MELHLSVKPRPGDDQWTRLGLRWTVELHRSGESVRLGMWSGRGQVAHVSPVRAQGAAVRKITEDLRGRVVPAILNLLLGIDDKGERP